MADMDEDQGVPVTPVPPQTVDDHKASAKFTALHQALEHAKVIGEHDAEKVVAIAERFWQWLVKEVAKAA